MFFSGFKQIKNWKKLKDKKNNTNIWYSSLTKNKITDLGEAIGEENRVDFYYNNKRQTLSRWPNNEFIYSDSVMGKTKMPSPSWIKIDGTKEGVFKYKEDNISKWQNEKEPILYGYWYWDWSEDHQRVNSIDTISKTIYLKEPYHHYGYKTGFRYYGVNLKSEIRSEERRVGKEC